MSVDVKIHRITESNYIGIGIRKVTVFIREILRSTLKNPKVTAVVNYVTCRFTQVNTTNIRKTFGDVIHLRLSRY
jgi:hypothetical protein